MYLCWGFIRKQCWVHHNFTPLRRVATFFSRRTRAAPVLSLSSVNTPTVRVGWEKSEEKVSRPASNDLLNYRDLPHCQRTHRRWNTMTKMYKKRKITPGCARPRARAKRRPGAACSADLSPPLCSDQRLFVKINFISRELPRGFGWVVSEGVDFAASANKFWALAFLHTACHSKLPRRERRRRRVCMEMGCRRAPVLKSIKERWWRAFERFFSLNGARKVGRNFYYIISIILLLRRRQRAGGWDENSGLCVKSLSGSHLHLTLCGKFDRTRDEKRFFSCLLLSLSLL